MIFSRKDC